jgi:hypothetical protein
MMTFQKSFICIALFSSALLVGCADTKAPPVATAAPVAAAPVAAAPAAKPPQAAITDAALVDSVKTPRAARLRFLAMFKTVSNSLKSRWPCKKYLA